MFHGPISSCSCSAWFQWAVTFTLYSQVVLTSYGKWKKKTLYNRTMHSADPAFQFNSSGSGFPPLCFDIHLPISVRSSTPMSSNVCMRWLFLEPFVTGRGVMILNRWTVRPAPEDLPQWLSSGPFAVGTCCDDNLLIGNINVRSEVSPLHLWLSPSLFPLLVFFLSSDIKAKLNWEVDNGETNQWKPTDASCFSLPVQCGTNHCSPNQSNVHMRRATS